MMEVSMTRMEKRMVTLSWCFALVICLLVLPRTDSYGQKREYPEREIKIVTGTSGSAADVWIRTWLDDFSKILQVPVVVINKGGGLASPIEAKRAKPDGYTLSYITQSMLTEFGFSSKAPVNLEKDFLPIGSFGSFPTLIVVEKSSPFMTFESLIDYAKKNPKKLKCGSAGLNVSHISFELVKRSTGTDIVMVPLNGSAPAVTALLGKHIDLLSISPSALMGLLKAGRVRVLLTSEKLKDFPDIPQFSEKGLNDAVVIGWSGLCVPVGVPKDAYDKLVNAFERIAKDPTIINRIETLGYTPKYLNSAELAIRLNKDLERIGTIAKEIGLED
jgi:tripartite-type tricarboxylate transporter receptor subunit TctC